MGFLADFGVSLIVFSGYTLPVLWFAPIVFVVFFVLAVFFGVQPILKASRMPPIQALSPVNYYGLVAEKKHNPLSRRGITWRLASRSLGRRQSVSVRVLILLSIVFVLLTVSIAGGLIASGTTVSWIQQTAGNDTIAIAHSSMGNQYKLLLSKFSVATETGNFNYSDPNLAVSNMVVTQLEGLSSISLVDTRLVLPEHLSEVSNFTIDPDTSTTYSVGDSRQGDAIVVGVNPAKLATEWSLKGQFLSGNGEAVIGDSVSQSMFYTSRTIALSDPLLESITFQNTTFPIVGICVDPLNNGQVAYVPIDQLENATGISNPNLLIIKLNGSIDRQAAIAQINSTIQAADPDLQVFDLSGIVQQNTNFLSSTWQTIMLLPLFTLASAALMLGRLHDACGG